MFNRAKMSMHLGKLKAILPMVYATHAEVGATDKRPPHLTALMMPSLSLLPTAIRFLEEALIVATKQGARTVHFPEGREVVVKMSLILAHVDSELINHRHEYNSDGPDFDRTRQQWEILADRFMELTEQVELID